MTRNTETWTWNLYWWCEKHWIEMECSFVCSACKWTHPDARPFYRTLWSVLLLSHSVCESCLKLVLFLFVLLSCVIVHLDCISYFQFISFCFSHFLNTLLCSYLTSFACLVVPWSIHSHASEWLSFTVWLCFAHLAAEQLTKLGTFLFFGAIIYFY